MSLTPSKEENTMNQMSLFDAGPSACEDPRYLSEQVITYIGNKRSLLPFIGSAIEHCMRELAVDKATFLDLFAGSGIVSRYMKRYSSHIIANDLELYSKYCSECYLSNHSEIDWSSYNHYYNFMNLNLLENPMPGFIREMYAPQDQHNIRLGERVFYTVENATFIDTFCRLMESVPDNIRHLFYGPVLSEASVHANTSGVFKGFYKGKNGIGQYGGEGKNALSRILAKMSLKVPVLSNFNCSFDLLQENALNAVSNIGSVDIAYFDPPYNQHPYGSNYFMLNLICDYVRPNEISRVSGIPTNWNRSDYNKKSSVESALFDTIDNCNAKFILISYSSEGFVDHDTFVRKLNEMGSLSILDKEYNVFKGCRNLSNRDIRLTEFLYLLDRR